jgi:hypothetical protein
MSKSLKRVTRRDAATLRELAAADLSIPPAVTPRAGGSVIINLRRSPSLIDELDEAAEADSTARKVIITRALTKAGYRAPCLDLEDRTPRKSRDRRAA